MRLIITIAFMACSYMASAQKATPTPPTPPTPATPSTSVKVSANTTSVVTINGKTYVSTDSSTPVKTEVKTNGKKSKSKSSSSSSSSSSSTSVSVNNSDFTYSIRASFDDYKTEKIRKILMENLEKDHFSSKGDTYTWKKLEDGEAAYSFVLSEGRLKGTVNKELNSNNAVDKFIALGEKISEALSNN
ncbi:hypothetical protein [Flavobacterium microcysteis]|uniref:Uncharacterized protein n=1 Tax=Flavobacterium microcysteis TaxID=2596891 RepID=A0A501Q302_9FLAO|nr:hypothetical protein [Flavobacterium microcysteis]TPD67053.1 hypothetical protein FJA49_12285 [Flavobacterium microcysteis]